MLGGRPWETGTVLDCSPAAQRQGIRRGMALGAAHRLVPEATFRSPHLDRYRAAVEAALDALSAFAPFVEGATDPADPAFGRLLTGIEGLDLLWGDEPTLLGRVVAALTPLLPGPPRAGIAGSRFAARAAAVVAREHLPGTDVAWQAVPPGGPATEAAFLAPLPIALLPTSPEARDRLRLFGLQRIGELARLPRSAVVARFGADGGLLHDLANGRDGRPLVPRRPPELLRASTELDPPVEVLEPLRFVLHRLAEVLAAQLAGRGAGATTARLELTLDGRWALDGRRPDGGRLDERQPNESTYLVEQVLPGPTASAEPIERLLLARLEAAPPPGPVAGMALELAGVRPIVGRQLGLFVPQAAGEARLDWQLADLAIRFGEGRILRASLRDPDARLPEERVTWTPAAGSGR